MMEGGISDHTTLPLDGVLNVGGGTPASNLQEGYAAQNASLRMSYCGVHFAKISTAFTMMCLRRDTFFTLAG